MYHIHRQEPVLPCCGYWRLHIAADDELLPNSKMWVSEIIYTHIDIKSE